MRLVPAVRVMGLLDLPSRLFLIIYPLVIQIWTLAHLNSFKMIYLRYREFPWFSIAMLKCQKLVIPILTRWWSN